MDVAILIIFVIIGVTIAIARQHQRDEGAQQMICPHCQTKGTVRLSPTKVKRGISGAKATGAFFTLGTSMLLTGLSRKERHLRARCSNCGVDWLI
jgi:DNA-directed RNA polymerase subunit RPC12/RpoP